jgi:hypothetical protein
MRIPSNIILFIPALSVPLSWNLLWTPLSEGNTQDRFAVLDAQRYFEGYTSVAFDPDLPIAAYCYSWNDCLHNYIYAFFHTYFGDAVWLNLILYIILTTNTCLLARFLTSLPGGYALVRPFQFYVPLLLNPFVYAYSCMPAKELVSVVALFSALVCFLWARHLCLKPRKASHLRAKSRLSVAMLLLFAILAFESLYRFQLLPISLCIIVCFSLRSRIAYRPSLFFKPKNALRIAFAFLVPLCFLVSYKYLSPFSLISNISYFFAPFNFPFPINPGLMRLYLAASFDPVLFLGGLTQLSGFLLSLVFFFAIQRKLLSYSSLLLLLLACFVGFIYGPTSTRYVATIGYFSLLSLLVDLCFVVSSRPSGFLDRTHPL